MSVPFVRSFRNLERKAGPVVVLADSILVAKSGPYLSSKESIVTWLWELAIKQIVTAVEHGIQI